MRNRLIQALVGVVFFTTALESFAMPITGEIGMGGNFIPVDSSWVQTGAATATGVDFDPNYFIVNTATGDFAGVSTLGHITDFQFDPFAAITDFWVIDGFSFELTSVVRGVTNDPDRFLVLNGTGVMSAAGFDDTLGTWAFTGDTNNSGTFSWSAGSAAVPEPGVMVLLGLGVCLIGFAGRIRSRV